jgi:hypothetical protein
MRHVLFVVVLISTQLFAETQPAQTQAAQPAAAATAATTTAATPTVEDNTPLENKPHVGVIGGVNLANFGRDITGSTMRFGFMGGLFIEIPVAENLFLTPTLWYLQKGYSDSGFTVTVDYLELPVNVLWKKPIGTSAKLRVFAGPQVGYLLIKNQTGTTASTIGSDPGLKAIDFGINGGLGVEMTFGKLTFLLDARYQYGLANVNDTGSLTTRDSSQAYSTSGILVNLGAYWPL